MSPTPQKLFFFLLLILLVISPSRTNAVGGEEEEKEPSQEKTAATIVEQNTRAQQQRALQKAAADSIPSERDSSTEIVEIIQKEEISTLYPPEDTLPTGVVLEATRDVGKKAISYLNDKRTPLSEEELRDLSQRWVQHYNHYDRLWSATFKKENPFKTDQGQLGELTQLSYEIVLEVEKNLRNLALNTERPDPDFAHLHWHVYNNENPDGISKYREDFQEEVNKMLQQYLENDVDSPGHPESKNAELLLTKPARISRHLSSSPSKANIIMGMLELFVQSCLKTSMGTSRDQGDLVTPFCREFSAADPSKSKEEDLAGFASAWRIITQEGHTATHRIKEQLAKRHNDLLEKEEEQRSIVEKLCSKFEEIKQKQKDSSNRAKEQGMGAVETAIGTSPALAAGPIGAGVMGVAALPQVTAATIAFADSLQNGVKANNKQAHLETENKMLKSIHAQQRALEHSKNDMEELHNKLVSIHTKASDLEEKSLENLKILPHYSGALKNEIQNQSKEHAHKAVELEDINTLIKWTKDYSNLPQIKKDSHSSTRASDYESYAHDILNAFKFRDTDAAEKEKAKEEMETAYKNMLSTRAHANDSLDKYNAVGKSISIFKSQKEIDARTAWKKDQQAHRDTIPIYDKAKAKFDRLEQRFNDLNHQFIIWKQLKVRHTAVIADLMNRVIEKNLAITHYLQKINAAERSFDRATSIDKHRPWNEAKAKAEEVQDSCNKLLPYLAPNSSKYQKVTFQKKRWQQKALLAQVRVLSKSVSSFEWEHFCKLLTTTHQLSVPLLVTALDSAITAINNNENNEAESEAAIGAVRKAASDGALLTTSIYACNSAPFYTSNWAPLSLLDHSSNLLGISSKKNPHSPHDYVSAYHPAYVLAPTSHYGPAYIHASAYAGLYSSLASNPSITSSYGSLPTYAYAHACDTAYACASPFISAEEAEALWQYSHDFHTQLVKNLKNRNEANNYHLDEKSLLEEAIKLIDKTSDFCRLISDIKTEKEKNNPSLRSALAQEQKAALAEVNAAKNSFSLIGLFNFNPNNIWNEFSQVDSSLRTKSWPRIKEEMNAFIAKPQETLETSYATALEADDAAEIMELHAKDWAQAMTSSKKAIEDCGHIEYHQHALDAARTTSRFLRAVAQFKRVSESKEEK